MARGLLIGAARDFQPAATEASLRVRPGPRTPPVVLTAEERSTLEAWARDQIHAPIPSHRAAIILACAGGGSNRQVALATGVTTNTVSTWRRRFLLGRLAGLRDARGDLAEQEPRPPPRAIPPPQPPVASPGGGEPGQLRRIWRDFLRERREREAPPDSRRKPVPDQ